MQAKPPPHDIELERMLVSAAMQSRDAFGDASEVIPLEDRFYDYACRTIWRAMRELNGKGENWDLPLLANYLSRTGQLADVGGYAAIAEIYAKSPTTTQGTHYSLKVAELWQLRSMVVLGTDLARDAAVGAGGTASDIRYKYEQQLFSLADNSRITKVITSAEMANEVDDRLERIMRGEKIGLPTGFVDIDLVFSGMVPSTVTLLAGRPGGGKTKLALNIVQKLAEQGVKIMFSSLEMSCGELGLRMVSAISDVDNMLITQNQLTDDQWRKVAGASARLKELPVYWNDRPGVRPTELLSCLRRMKRQHGVELAVIDHILLMQPDQRMGRSRNDEVGDISRMIKLIAKEINIPILALCQMNRGIEGRNDAPRLSDLRDSGNLEQDADNVIFLHKPKDETGNMVDIYIAKQRNGPTGKCTLYDRKGVFRFENAATRYLP